jgi:hypothetical protein
MTTDLREQQGKTIRPKEIGLGRVERGARWPFVATGVVLVVLAATAVLVFTEGSPRPVLGPDRWEAGVEDLMTDVREGSGYAPAAGTESIAYPHGLENPGAYGSSDPGNYARGALTDNREGSGWAGPIQHSRPPLGSTRYADGALTGIRES